MVDTKKVVQITLPRLSDSDDESVIVFWHKSVGDKVEKGEALVEVQTEKAVSEIEADSSGTLVEINIPRGDVATVGDVLAVLDPEFEEGEDTTNSESEAKPEQEKVEQHSERSFVKVPPRVRKLAKEKGVDLTTIVGTGPNGKPTVEDVEKAAAESEKDEVQDAEEVASAKVTTQEAYYDNQRIIATPSVRRYAREQEVDIHQIPTIDGRITKEDVRKILSGEAASPADADVRKKLIGVRKAMAKAMTHSKSTIPHVTHFDEVNVTKLVGIHNSLKTVASEKNIKLTYLPYIVQALVHTLKEYPELNAAFDDENQEIILKKSYNIGIATNTNHGLMVPVLQAADQLSIFELAQQITSLSQKAAENRLTNKELQGGTCTISNIGSAGGQWFTPIINPPETAILGVGKITKKPIIKDDAFAVGNMLTLSLSYDHRVIDGILAQNAINYLKELLQEANNFHTF
ncbi:2-oxo acid dehydrogenase subunit E2 [Bacillaceae bacterium S4-13-58]